jgi:hypothetical protein
MKDLASLALSEGKNFKTFGKVRRSLSIPSSKEDPFSFFFFFMNSPMTDFDCPRLAIVKDPTLFNLITSGIEGKIRTASSLSLSGVKTSTTFKYIIKLIIK